MDHRRILNPLAHPICLSLPQRHPTGPAWYEHIPFAMVLVDLLQPRVVVALGVQAGDVYCAFCQAVQILALPTRCYGIDTWPGRASTVSGADLLNDLRAHHDPRYGTFSILVRSTFDEAGERFAEGSIDLLHIDGGRPYGAVKHDLEAWLPKMSADGVVLLGETRAEDGALGSPRLWHEIKDRYPHFEFPHGRGLGLLAIGHIRSPELRAMLNATADEAATVRDFFYQLGHRLAAPSPSAGQEPAPDHRAGREGPLAAAPAYAENARLAFRVDAHEHTIRTLTADLARHRTELLEHHRQLQERDDLLQRITNSRGWRLLNRYRQLKHCGRRLAGGLHHAWEALRGREYRPRLQPLHDLRLGDAGDWESTGRDPQFSLCPPWPRGWTQVTLDLAVHGPSAGPARLYVDRGQGYHERDSVHLGDGSGSRTRFVRLDVDVVGLRLDPCESSARFRVGALTLKAVPAWRLPVGRDARRGLVEVSSRFGQARVGKPIEVQPAIDPYQAWLEVNEWNARRAALLGTRLSQLGAPPLLSVLMPVYDPPLDLLDRAIASVVSQCYWHWELCIADDASTDPAVGRMLERWGEREPRIRVIRREIRGQVSHATNSAAAIARGDFLLFVDQDDELTPDALGEVAIYLSEHPDTDILYSDDDKIDLKNRRFEPAFKPDWSPELLLSYMYLSHVLVMRRSVFNEIGGLRVGYEGSQDYDLALRAADVTDRVGHLPKVLYHWRARPGSTALSGHTKPESFRAGRQAVQDALDRRRVRAEVHQPEWAARVGYGIFSPKFPDEGPRVAIIIPTKNQIALLKACLSSLAATTYKRYEVIIVDNESDDGEALEFLRRTSHRVMHVPNVAPRFSFAAINNRAVEETDADCVLFLNNDTEIMNPRWLSQMMGYLGLPGVGAVGARLRFPDGRLQHAGIVHGYYHGLPGPAFKLAPASDPGYLNYTMVARNYSAVTAACLLTPRDLFRHLGGFDAQRFAVAYNDVDYCYRLRGAGYRVVYCPEAELIHHEGASRGFVDDPAEPAAFRKTYGTGGDPFYNPNLSLQDERFAIAARTLPPAKVEPIPTLMCAFNLNLEGAPHSQFELTVRLKETGVIDPIVYCPQEGPLRAAYEAHAIRVEIFEHPLRGVLEAPAYEAAISRFAQWIADLGVDLVYGNTRPTFYAIDAAKRIGLPSIWNPRESEPWQTYFDDLGGDIAQRALRCFAYPYQVIFVSDATRQSCAGLETHHNFMTIHTGLDRRRFVATLHRWPREAARHQLGVGPDELMFLLVGTICERKGQLDLIDALSRLDEVSARTIRCFIVGEGASGYSKHVEQARDSLPAAKRSRVEIVSATSEIGLYYAASDAFVCTSRIESFPRVILEAMTAGLPIITTPVYGIAEQVRENVNALLYAPGDAQGLAAHMKQLCQEPGLRRWLSTNSHHVLDTLIDFDAMVAAYASVFREAWVSGRPR